MNQSIIVGIQGLPDITAMSVRSYMVQYEVVLTFLDVSGQIDRAIN
jgi:hypothetical protein